MDNLIVGPVQPLDDHVAIEQPVMAIGDLVLCAVYERLRKVDRADFDRLANSFDVEIYKAHSFELYSVDKHCGCIKQFDVNLE